MASQNGVAESETGGVEPRLAGDEAKSRWFG